MSTPRIGIIGGSGLGEALRGRDSEVRQLDTPFGPPSSPILLSQWQGGEVAMLQRHGLGHVYNPTRVPYRANIFALKQLGVTHVIASGAVGSLHDTIRPGELVIPDQIIDKTHHRPSTFYDPVAVHVELAEPFCPVTRRWLIQASQGLQGPATHASGTYVCMEGPALSTKAESRLHRQWGGDLIGMTACPEAKLAREAELAYALIALPTDYDCWRAHDPTHPQPQLLAQIMANLNAATQRATALIQAALADTTLLQEQPSPAHRALELAIWTDKDRIDPAMVERLGVLWGRHFDPATEG